MVFTYLAPQLYHVTTGFWSIQMNQLKYAVWEYDPQQWMMHRLSFDFDGKTIMYDHMNIRLAYQDIKEGRNDRKFQNEWLRQRVEHVQIVSLNNDYDKSLKNQQLLFYGLEMNYNNVISTGEETNINTGETNKVSTRYPDGSNIYLIWRCIPYI